MTKDEALKLCLEYIEKNAHERRHVRWAIKDALAQPIDDIASIIACRDALDAQSVPKISPESLYNIMEAMGFAPRPWVGLTNWEREAIALECGAISADWLVFMEAVERALKEKNA